VLEQCWFPGVHANIGGGYAKTGLSDIPLQWMMAKLAGAGLALDPLSVAPDWREAPEESRRCLYRLIPPRWRPMHADGAGPRYECLSEAARKKRGTGYAPGNLVACEQQLGPAIRACAGPAG
jgi:hypothetical protein